MQLADTTRKPVQRAICCPCGRPGIHGNGLCASCYTLRRQDDLLFGGLREQVLERDRYLCRGCGRPRHRLRSLGVHHRHPGVSTMRSMVSICPVCHPRIHHTLVLRRSMTPALRRLWREFHPHAHEQIELPFHEILPVPEAEPATALLWEDLVVGP